MPKEGISQPEKLFIIKHATLMSQGVWNDYFYDKEEIQKAFENTDWGDKSNSHLFLDHDDKNAASWIGHVRNMSFDGDTLYGDLAVSDPAWIQNLKYGKPKFGISPKLIGGTDENKAVHNFTYKNFSLVTNPAVKTAYINNMAVLELSEEEFKPDETEEAEEGETPEEEGITEERLKEIMKEELKAIEDSKKEAEKSMDRLTDLLELCELKKLSSAAVGKKAEELMAKDEKLSYTDAFRSAVKLQEEEEEKKEEEKPEEEKPKEEAPKEEVPAEGEVKPEAEAPAEAEAKKEMEELKQQVKTLSEKLNEPAVKTLKKTEHELSSSGDVDMDMLNYLQEFDKEVTG